MTADWIIKTLGLELLPGEGGFYRETYRSSERFPAEGLPDRYESDKHLATAMYYLLTPDTCSRLHRLPTDEVYHFYFGDPVTMLLLSDGGSGRVVTLGSDLSAGHLVQTVVPRDTWQGSFLTEGGRYALMGTTMAPGFDFSDFEKGGRQSLVAEYGEYADMIRKLT